MALLDGLTRWRMQRAALKSALDPFVGTTQEFVDGHYVGPERRGKPRLRPRIGTHVLIVDDSSTILALLRRMLEQNGCVVEEATSGTEALEIMKATRPELVFLDIVMPEVDGFTVLRQMRRTPAMQQIPVIMMSGNAQATEQFYVQRIGADDFMKKPFSRAELFSRIEALLDADQSPRRPVASATAAAPE